MVSEVTAWVFSHVFYVRHLVILKIAYCPQDKGARSAQCNLIFSFNFLDQSIGKPS